jgi:NAD(P)-dependent dehydrogenase (short-subunit alcohol dehydrogenase family)
VASPDRRFALVTGANRGIGLEVVRQLAGEGFTTVLGARDVDKGSAAAAALAGEGLDVEARRLDVADSKSVRELSAGLDRDLGRLDVLVNNAAIHYDTSQRGVDADLGVVQEALETNLLGAWRTAQACLPLLRRSEHGRIVNVSSESGSLASMGAGAPAYSVSKAALNALAGARRRVVPRGHPGQLGVSRLGGHGHGWTRRAAGAGWGGKRALGRAPSGRRPQRWLLP